jgi:hypothetical protein
MTRYKSKATRDVTKASNPRYMLSGPDTNVPGAVLTGRKMPDITPPKMVSGFSKGIRSRESNLNNSRSFTLPDTINPMETWQQSFGERRMSYNYKAPRK